MKRKLSFDNRIPRKKIELQHFIPDDCWPNVFSYIAGAWIGPLERVCKKWKEILEKDLNAFNFQSYPLALMANGYKTQPSVDPFCMSAVFIQLNKAVSQYKRQIFTHTANFFLKPFQKHFNVPISVILTGYQIHSYQPSYITVTLGLKFGSTTIMFKYFRESVDFYVRWKIDDSGYEPLCGTNNLHTHKFVYTEIIETDKVTDKCILKTFTSDVFMEMVLVLYFHAEWLNVLRVIDRYFEDRMNDRSLHQNDFYELVIQGAPRYN